ncbi:MAG: DUF1697 domain-containing protein [Xanthomonadaceae bacterium]|nr:DUF1697 domain-containing protein [Xanthomonadaceae bacterium]
MTTQIALFRGINVGKAKRVAMADLKTMFEGLGFANVRTLLNSGNVVFESGKSAAAANAKRIAAVLRERMGVDANTLVLTAKDLDAAIADNPFAARIDNPSRFLVGFFMTGADPKPLDTLRREFPNEDFAVGARACYLWCPNGISESRLAETLIGAKHRERVTTRNWATVLKLRELAST